MNTANNNKLDQWLDKALSQRVDIEPRRGLEARIFANLSVAEEQQATGWRRRWIFAFASTIVVCSIATAIWFSGVFRKHNQPMANIQSSPIVRRESQRRRTAQAPGPKTLAGSVARHHLASVRMKTGVTGARPRLEQFPSPRALSEQETLLLAYVAEFPKEAAEVAKEQAQREKELEALYPTVKPESHFREER
jgi:hypothetical protein